MVQLSTLGHKLYEAHTFYFTLTVSYPFYGLVRAGFQSEISHGFVCSLAVIYIYLFWLGSLHFSAESYFGLLMRCRWNYSAYFFPDASRVSWRS